MEVIRKLLSPICGFVQSEKILGYVSAYNILLRLEGIDCFGFIDDSQHIWSRAVLDGKTLDIDSYYEDSTGEYDKYFCMPYEFAMRHYDDIE